MNDQDIRHERELAHTEVALTLAEIERAVESVLATLPPDRLLRLGLVCQHPEELEPLDTCAAVADWTDVLGPLVGRRLFELGPNRVVNDLRTRALVGALKDGLAVRAAP